MTVSESESHNDPESKEAFGTIVGVEANCVVVDLDDGDEILCRSVKRLHRPLGFYTVPVGRRVRIRMYSVTNNKRPLILEVLDNS